MFRRIVLLMVRVLGQDRLVLQRHVILLQRCQHAEGFDAVANPGCWSTALLTGSTNWAPDDTSDGVPTPRTGARFAGKTWAGNDDALLISPPYNLAAYAAQTVQLNVWIYRSANGLSTDRVTFYANNATNLTGATQLLDIPLPISAAPTVASAGWYNYTVNTSTFI